MWLTPRNNEKIAEKMRKFVPGMKKTVLEIAGSFPNSDLVLDFLSKCLDLDPKKRPSPL